MRLLILTTIAVVTVIGVYFLTMTPTGTAQAEVTEIATEPTSLATAVFAGGCFWCVESDFEKLEGVSAAVSGYTGGDLENPTYKQVSYTETGHFEAAEISYDPSIISYRALVDYFFTTIDPLDDGGQFCDRGSSYKTAIFVRTAAERSAAEAAKITAEKTLGKPIVTPILDAKTFWRAEEYHQDYYKKNPLRYRYYRTGCGRDRRLQELWGKKN